MKPKVLHVTLSFLPAFGGQENCVLSLALRHAAEWDVHVLANYRSRAMHGDRYRVHNLLPCSCDWPETRPALGRLYLFAQLLALQARYRFDVWDAHYTNEFGRIPVELALRLRIPCVWSIHDISCVRNAEAFAQRHPALLRRMPSNGLIMVSGSRYLADGINAGGQIRCVHIPRGCDHDFFRRTPASPGGRIQKFNLIAIARNVPDKRLSLLITLMEELLQSGQRDVGLTIITHDAGALAAAVAQRGLKEHIRLLRTADLQSNERFCLPPAGVVAELKSADCLISMSRYEASPNVVIEAFAAGLPVILSDIPAHREMVTHGRNGFLVAGEDTREMARRVLTLRDDAELRKRAVEAARESARQYDWDRTAERYADTYREVMGAVRGKARR